MTKIFFIFRKNSAILLFLYRETIYGFLTMKIIAAEKSDAPLIGRVIVEAIGNELAESLAGEFTVADVVNLFARLAAREDSQYSYLNALKAVDTDGTPMGFIIGYDGARLHELREAFFEEARTWIRLEIEGSVADECRPDEFYLDSLAVFPEFRGHGIAGALIDAMARRAREIGKPAGLLCSKENHRARRLYERMGFRQVGESFFAGELMDHMQKT